MTFRTNSLGGSWPAGLALAGLLAAMPVLAAAISQGFRADEKYVPGTIVAVQPDRSGTVVAADSDHSENLIGVVADVQDSTLALGSPDSAVQVVTTGPAKAFVSDLAGPIKAGDQVTASPLRGVGMKATESGKVVGVAQADFNAGAAKTVSVRTKDNKSQNVRVGEIPVLVQVAYYAPPGSSLVPPGLQLLANSVVRKPVPAGRVLIALAIVLAGIITVAIILFSAVRSAIVSIGRNPLARSGVYKGLLQILVTTIAILAVAMAAVYGVLNF